MNNLQTTDIKARLWAEKRAHYLTHPAWMELAPSELQELRVQSLERSLRNVNDFQVPSIQEAYEGTPIHVAMKLNPMATTTALVTMLTDALAMVQVANKIDGVPAIRYAVESCIEYDQLLTLEDWRIIMKRIKQGTRKRYNKFELADLLDYFREFNEEKVQHRETVVRNHQLGIRQELEQFFAEFPGDFRTPEERIRDREAASRPKSYEDLVNGKTSISPAERQAMQERDRQRRNA